MKIRHVFRSVTVEEERDFERNHIQGMRESYLRLDPMEKYEKDEAYREKVDRVKAGVLDENGKFPSGRILDIGGNTGGEATILQQQGGRFVIGDVNEVALQVSRQRVEKFNLSQPEYVAFDVHKMPFADNSFDVITVIEALHHFPDYGKALSEIHRVLRPGGKLFSIEPNGINPVRRLSEIRDRLRGSVEKSFFKSQLQSLLSNAGFDSVKITSVGGLNSTWKLDRLPAYRRWITVLHHHLQQNVPAYFGQYEIVAFKRPDEQDATPEAEAESLSSILRTPGGKESLSYVSEKASYVSESGGEYEALDGIPVLID